MKAMAFLFAAAIFCRKIRSLQIAANIETAKLSGTRRQTGSLRYGCLLVLLGMTNVVSAQNDWRANNDVSSRPFWVNVLYFRDGGGEKTLTNVLVEVPFASCAFKKVGDGYEANVEAGVVFDDGNGFQIDGKTISNLIRTSDLAATGSSRQTHIFCFEFRMEPGSYNLRVMIGDEQVVSRFSHACKIDIPSFAKTQLQISSLLLARQLDMSGDNAIMQKSGRSLIPNVPHLFVAQKQAGFVYFEAYNLSANSSPVDSFQCHVRLSRQEREIYSASCKIPKPGPIAVINLPLHFSRIEAGEYGLSITIFDPDANRNAGAFAVLYVTPAAAPTLGFFDGAAESNN